MSNEVMHCTAFFLHRDSIRELSPLEYDVSDYLLNSLKVGGGLSGIPNAQERLIYHLQWTPQAIKA